MRVHLRRFFPAIFWFSLAVLFETKPQDVGTNLSTWAEFFRVDHPPAWITQPSTDKWVLLILGCLIFVSVVWAIWPALWAVWPLRRSVATGPTNGIPLRETRSTIAQGVGDHPRVPPSLTPTPSPTPIASVQLRFINGSSGEIFIELEPPAPCSGPFTRVARGDPCPITTYPGHSWIVKDANGKKLIRYVATTDLQQNVLVGANEHLCY